MNPDPPSSVALVHIIRHGEALHNVHRGYPHRDPPLTEAGWKATKEIVLPGRPDIIIISPMTRTIQTAMSMFPSLQDTRSPSIPVQIWPDLREANDAICNQGVSRAEIQAKFPQFDFSECHEQWNYASHDIADATMRAERVRERIHYLSATSKSIAIITHRCFIAFLVNGERFQPAETRSYKFATEAQSEELRRGLHCDLLQEHDFGPTVLLPQ
jgi:broad specificity phosphatase PhoE